MMEQWEAIAVVKFRLAWIEEAAEDQQQGSRDAAPLLPCPLCFSDHWIIV